MKKISLLLILSVSAIGLFAQTLHLEGKGGYKSTWLLNKNISDDGNEQDYAAGWGSHYGLGVSMFFNKNLGVGVDFMLNNHTGAYAGEFDSVDYKSNVKIKSIDIPVMFKVKSEAGGFLEIGLQYSSFSSAKYTLDYHITLPSSQIQDSTYESTVDTSYAKSNLSLVFGVGIQIKFTDRIGLKTGFRFEYGLSDLEGVDGFGNEFKSMTYGSAYPYEKYQKTNAVSASFMLGVYFILGSEKDSTVP